MPAWWRRLFVALALALGGHAAFAAQGTPALVAFYVPWEPTALASLKAHAGSLDVFAPMWASLVSTKGEVRWESDPEAHAALAAAPRRPKVMPVVSNAHDDIWDVAAAQAVIGDPRAAEAFAEALAARARGEGFAGYVMDFENLPPAGVAAYPALVARLRDRLHADGRQLWVTALLSTDPATEQRLLASADAVVLMAYDQCWAASTPGPIADDAWLSGNLAAKLAGADPRRFVAALASYGYDWPAGRKAQVVSVSEALRLAAKSGAPIEHAPGSNAHFSYRGTDGPHQVWFADGADFARQRRLASGFGVKAVGLWRMGLEDPALWTAKPPAQAPTPSGPSAACAPLPR